MLAPRPPAPDVASPARPGGRRLLLVADDPALADAVRAVLDWAGDVVVRRGSLDALAVAAPADGCTLAILDATATPSTVTPRLCVRLGATVPLLVVGALGAPTRTALLAAGATVCLASGAPEELAAQVRALLRFAGDRGRARVTERWLLDLEAQELTDGREVHPLPSLQFRLLRYLVDHPGVVVSRETLAAAGWGAGYAVALREVDQYVHYLRRCLEPEPHRPRYLLTRRGGGYQYRPPKADWR